MSSPILDSREPNLASAKDILARLERYAAAHRSALVAPSGVAASVRLLEAPAVVTTTIIDDFQPHEVHRHRIDPATIDLFPYDLTTSVMGCIATIVAFLWLPVAAAFGVTVALMVGGESTRRLRWFPSVGVNLMIGVVAGAILVALS